MNPFMMQQDVPKVNELWKNEVNKYRLWIILFFIGVSVIAILSLVSIIMNGLGITNGIITKYQKTLNQNAPKNVDISWAQARISYLFSMIIMPVVMLSLIIFSLILSAITVNRSYKLHNFAKLSWAGIFIIQLSSFFALINIVQFFFSGGQQILSDALPGTIYSIIVMFLYIPIWLFANKVSRIRKLFLLSERIELLKQDPNYEKMRQQMQAFQSGMNSGNSPFGFNQRSNNSTTNSTNKPVKPNSAANKVSGTATNTSVQNTSVVSEIDKELSKLSMKQLREIAKKLYISGYDIMARPELISSIKRATHK